jgi:cbb3-type cytochrome oxidase subunit 3
MRLSEIMADAGLSFYAEAALVLFLSAFLVVLWQIFSPTSKETLEQHRLLPLDDSDVATKPEDGKAS